MCFALTKCIRITKGDIYREFPFPNGASLAKIKGVHLIEAMESVLGVAERVLGSFPHLSAGIEIIYDVKLTPGKRITKFTFHGEDIQLDREYTVGKSDYFF